MAQTRVSEFFPSKKKTRHSNATKRRRVDPTTNDDDVSSLKQAIRSNAQVQSKPAEPEVETVTEAKSSTKAKARAKSKSTTSTTKGKPRSTRQSSRRGTTEEKDESQRRISDIFIPQVNEYKNSTQNLSFNFAETDSEAVPSAYDEHDGPEGTPTKQLRLTSKTTGRRSRKEVQNPESTVTPQKDDMPIATSTPTARKRLQMNKEKTAPALSKNAEKIVESISEELTSAIPVTPEIMKTPTKSVRPVAPKSPNVKAALDKCKKMMINNSGEKQIRDEIKARLKKCGKLEELKSQLSEMNKNLKQVKQSKTPIPKLKKFDNIEIEVTQPIVPPSPVKSPAKSARAYERYHSLATPATPSLNLPYKYKLLMEMFRGMDTVVSMMHNRSEICTFSKLKAAVQTMTKRNFEKKNVGQIKTVYPTAYHLRQERVPCYGNKMSGYQLSVEANIDLDPNTKGANHGKINFSASHLLQRRQRFHTGLVNIVKQHHAVFLSNMSHPLSIPDNKITRWHPQFPLDEVVDVEAADLPEPPNVQKFHSAKDVLEQTRGKLIPKVEKALADVAKNSSHTVKSELKQEKIGPVTTAPAIKGVPMSLLEKIRAKEAKKLEEALTRNPVEDKKKAMINRLPDMIRIIRSYFVTEKKPSITMENMVQKLADSYRTSIALGDAESHVKLLLELAPEWLTMVQIKKGRYLKIDRNIDIHALSSKIQNQAKKN